MNLSLTGHHVDITPALRSYVDTKMERIKRHYSNITNAHFTLSVGKTEHKAEATLNVSGADLHADATERDNMYAAIDGLTDKLDRLITKHKERQVDHHMKEAQKADIYADVQA